MRVRLLLESVGSMINEKEIIVRVNGSIINESEIIIRVSWIYN